MTDAMKTIVLRQLKIFRGQVDSVISQLEKAQTDKEILEVLHNSQSIINNEISTL